MAKLKLFIMAQKNSAKVTTVVTAQNANVTAPLFVTSLANAILTQKAGKLNVATYALKFTQYQVEYNANNVLLCTLNLSQPAQAMQYKTLAKRQQSLLRKLARIQIGTGVYNLVYVLPTETPAVTTVVTE